jgi:hypothetical protein
MLRPRTRLAFSPPVDCAASRAFRNSRGRRALPLLVRSDSRSHAVGASAATMRQPCSGGSETASPVAGIRVSCSVPAVLRRTGSSRELARSAGCSPGPLFADQSCCSRLRCERPVRARVHGPGAHALLARVDPAMTHAATICRRLDTFAPGRRRATGTIASEPRSCARLAGGLGAAEAVDNCAAGNRG